MTRNLPTSRNHGPLGNMLALKIFALIALVSTGYAQSAQAPATSNAPPTPIDARDRNVYASDQADRSTARKLMSNIWLDQKDIWTSPFRMQKSDAKWWILVGAGTAALIATDYTISKQLPNSGTSVSIGTDISRAGQVYSVYPFAAGLYGLGVASHNRHLEETGALGIQALVDADIAFNVLKIVTLRERPLEGDKGGHFWKGGLSFPSGHAAQAWAIGTVVASEFGNHKWVPVLAYGYATAVSASRVMARQHFPADAFVGSAMGFFIGRYVVRTEKTHLQHSRSQHAFLFQPSIGPFVGGGYTVGVTLTWPSDRSWAGQ